VRRVHVSPEVAARFPGLAVAWVSLEGVAVGPAGAPAAEDLKRAAEAGVRSRRTAEGLKDDPVFRAYRDFYWKLGIDPTKTRPAGEALNRRVLNGGVLPAINAFVDAYNAASLATGVPIGAYDADRLAGDALSVRFAAPGEPFQGIAEPEPRALAGGETVLADAARAVNFYPYRDAEATKVREGTTRAFVVACGAPGVPLDLLAEATRLAAENVLRTCGGLVAASGP
jgi:DNA/RNA-binding domain of Phe-tRNA-synthetase-like protein